MPTPFPYSLPPVFASYLETFQVEPDKTLQRLEGFLKRRGPDAIGHLLLAWMLMETGNREEALKKARAAAVFAPGSGRIAAAPYLFNRAGFFSAGLPASAASAQVSSEEAASLALSDLDFLIEELTRPENARISFSPDYGNADDLGEQALEDAGDIASVTLARILEGQQKWTEALDMYRRLDHGTGVYTDAIARCESALQAGRT